MINDGLMKLNKDILNGCNFNNPKFSCFVYIVVDKNDRYFIMIRPLYPEQLSFSKISPDEFCVKYFTTTTYADTNVHIYEHVKYYAQFENEIKKIFYIANYKKINFECFRYAAVMAECKTENDFNFCIKFCVNLLEMCSNRDNIKKEVESCHFNILSNIDGKTATIRKYVKHFYILIQNNGLFTTFMMYIFIYVFIYCPLIVLILCKLLLN